MKIKEYLENLLNNSSEYQLSDSEKNQAKNDLVGFIFSKLTSKKFRKWKMDLECIDRTKNAIKTRVNKNQPVKIVYFQGGYKLWRLPSSPEADWAEFFNISYLLKYLAPISTAYKQGVELTYYCHTFLMEKHDNLTTEEIQKYMNSFQYLINEFQKHIPSNFKINILRDADIYSRTEYFKALEEGRHEAEKQIAEWPEKKIEDHKRMAMLNIKWDGKENWAKLNTQGKEEKLHLASVYEVAATTNLPKVMQKVKAPDLVLLFTKPSPLFIGVGSTFTSAAKHWVGFGVLEKHNNSYIPRILTPSQFEHNQKNNFEKIEVNFFKELKNFKEVIILKKPLTFY